MPSKPRPELEAWISRISQREITAIKRWFHIETKVGIGGDSTLLLRRVLGWDDSPTPPWANASNQDRLNIHCTNVRHDDVADVISTLRQRGSEVDEIRRIELPVSDWNNVVSTEAWNLGVPVVAYELWAPGNIHDNAHSAWASLTEQERQASGISAAQLGYLGSTVVLVPQVRPYLVGTNDLMIPGGPDVWGELRLLSEVFDGGITLARSVDILRTEPSRSLEPVELGHVLRIHYVNPNLAEMNAATPNATADAIAALPRDAHGHSGSDWRLTVIGTSNGDTSSVGLIRGIGGFYFTQEPWRDRSPPLGFSGPARVLHVPPQASAAAAAFTTLVRAGAPACICDPYATDGSLQQVAPILRGGRVITKPRAVNKGELTKAWTEQHGLSVKTIKKIHDRFVVGPRHGFLVGYSLNGLGKEHSFVVTLDNTMRLAVANVFEDLWNQGKDAW